MIKNIYLRSKIVLTLELSNLHNRPNIDELTYIGIISNAFDNDGSSSFFYICNKIVYENNDEHWFKFQ